MKMAVLTNDELRKVLADRFGESEDENDIAFVEDITDTFTSLSSNDTSKQLKDLQDKYSNLQKRYRDRFFNTGSDDSTDYEELLETTPDPEPKVLKFDDLFSKGD